MSRSMPVRAALVACALGLAAPGAAQGVAARPETRPLPADPPSAPPAPADLSAGGAAQARPPKSPEVPLLPVPTGLEVRDGAWRLRFPEGADAPVKLARAGLADIGRRLAGRPEGRVTVLAQASGPANDLSTARRLSLARGLLVKEALVAAGLPATRVDVRPMGVTPEAADAVDVQPPGARPPPAARP